MRLPAAKEGTALRLGIIIFVTVALLVAGAVEASPDEPTALEAGPSSFISDGEQSLRDVLLEDPLLIVTA